MKDRKILFGAGLTLALMVVIAAPGFSQAQPASNRIPQQIVVNGQRANGAYVQSASGAMQRYTCPNPQSYTTPDGASTGWACYDQASSTYLLNSLPPASQASAPVPAPQASAPASSTAEAPSQDPATQPPAAVVYQQPAPAVVYAPAPYPYGYPYPVYGPVFGPGIIFSAGFYGPGFYGRGFYPGFRGGFGGFRRR